MKTCRYVFYCCSFNMSFLKQHLFLRVRAFISPPFTVGNLSSFNDYLGFSISALTEPFPALHQSFNITLKLTVVKVHSLNCFYCVPQPDKSFTDPMSEFVRGTGLVLILDDQLQPASPLLSQEAAEKKFDVGKHFAHN